MSVIIPSDGRERKEKAFMMEISSILFPLTLDIFLHSEMFRVGFLFLKIWRNWMIFFFFLLLLLSFLYFLTFLVSRTFCYFHDQLKAVLFFFFGEHSIWAEQGNSFPENRTFRASMLPFSSQIYRKLGFQWPMCVCACVCT